jgi:hypothetical protein
MIIVPASPLFSTDRQPLKRRPEYPPNFAENFPALPHNHSMPVASHRANPLCEPELAGKINKIKKVITHTPVW